MKNTSAPPPSPQELLHELKSFANEAESMIVDPVSGCSPEALSLLRARLAAAREGFREVYHHTKQQVVDGARSTDLTIREHPYRALALALGVGLLAGALLGRRSS